MTDSIKFEIDQKVLDGFIDELNKLGPEIGQRVFAKAINNGSKKIQQRAKDNLANTKGTGRLANSIKIRNVTKYRPFFWKASIEVPGGKKRNDETGAYYAHMVEFGHSTGKKNKTYVPPNPFMTNAVKELESSIKAEFVSDLKSQLERQWAKIARKK